MNKLDPEPRLAGASAPMLDWARSVVRAVNGLIDSLTAALLAIASKAPLDSPPLTGTPTAPTPPSTDNSGRLATTAWAKLGFVLAIGGTASYIKFPDWMGALIVQWGTSVVTSDGSAQAAFSFPFTYPTAVYTTVGLVGDNGDNKLNLFGTTGTTTSVARWVFIDSTTAAGKAGHTARINWISFGR